eukprot:1772005-Rhodomonas_salina.2
MLGQYWAVQSIIRWLVLDIAQHHTIVMDIAQSAHVAVYSKSVPDSAGQARRQLLWISTGHRVAAYARSVPDSA